MKCPKCGEEIIIVVVHGAVKDKEVMKKRYREITAEHSDLPVEFIYQ